MKLNSVLSLVALAAAPSVVTAKMEFATQATHELEKMYVQDCQVDTTPHGFYGAFLQPCEFQFRRSNSNSNSNSKASDYDVCSDEHSTLLASPLPMHWFFNMTDHFDKKDWDSMSSDDIPSADELMLWPDQCVGVAPRCYSIADAPRELQDTLVRLFGDKIPTDATHVRVDCRGDAMQLSRVVYAFADGFEKSTPTLIAWMVTVILVSTVLAMWCIYACLRMCCYGGSGGNRAKYANYTYEPMLVEGKVIPGTHYKAMEVEDGNHEKATLLTK